jgi:hypothetical protein
MTEIKVISHHDVKQVYIRPNGFNKHGIQITSAQPPYAALAHKGNPLIRFGGAQFSRMANTTS